MENFSPEELQIIMEMIMQGQTASAEQEAIKRQLEQAQSMRVEGLGGRRTGRGATMSPTLLNLIGGLGKEYAGQKLGKEAEIAGEVFHDYIP